MRVAAGFLSKNEALNNKFFGVVGDAADGRYKGGDNLWLTTHLGEETIGAAIWTPPHEFSIAQGSPEEAVLALAHEALSHRADAIDLLRVPPTYARVLVEEFGWDYQQKKAMGIYQLATVIPPPTARGTFRTARDPDVGELLLLARGFAAETGTFQAVGDALNARVSQMVQTGALGVWEFEGQLVSMAAVRGSTPRGVRISWVYTPLEHRGNGFASAVVASLSQRALDAGQTFCFLFTDLENASSNKIYQRIGYQRTGSVGIFRRKITCQS